MAQDKVDKLKKLAEVAIEILNGGGFTNKEAAQFFATLIKQVNEAKDSVRLELDKAKNELEASVDGKRLNIVEKRKESVSYLDNKITKTFEGLYDVIEKSRTSVEGKFSADILRLTSRLNTIPNIEELITELKNEITEIDNKIEPFPDLSGMGSEIEGNIENNLAKYGERIRDSLELLQDDERLDKSAIKGLESELEAIKEANKAPSGAGHSIVGRDIIIDIDISTQLDGVTKTFNLQAIYNIVSVDLSSYPYGSLRKNIDYTYTPTSITFTSEIAAATQLSAGQRCILTVVQA